MADDAALDAARDALEAATRDALAAAPSGDRHDAARLACLLEGRERLAAALGERPGGALAALPAPFDRAAAGDGWRAVEDALADLQGVLPDDPPPRSIGAGYARTLGEDARGTRGQFVTPAPVADALVRWAIAGARDGPSRGDRDGPPRLLDPAVGTGTFPLAAVDRLREVVPGLPPADLPASLPGVDPDGVALHLAGLRLAAAVGDPAPAALPLHRASFFDCAPAGAVDARDAAVALPAVDAVVGNPPYVRAEALAPDADHFRRHLAAFGPDGEAPWLGGDDALGRRSDAYVYFVTQATRLLRPGGRLALVLPTKWLSSAYGEALRRFLRAHHRVHAVVGFDARAFGDALVDTCLLLAERDDGADADAPLRFVRAGSADADALLAAVDDGAAAGDRGVGVVERTQSALTASGRLGAPLEAPAELLALLDGSAFVRLDELAEVARGTMTGANAFFLLDDADVERFGVAPRFLRPAVRSLRWVDRPRLHAGDVERHLLDVHDFVEAVAQGRRRAGDEATGAGDLQRAVTDALASDDHRGLLRYVAAGERAGHHRGRTCRSRRVWFDLGPLRAPAALVPKLLRERLFAVRNAAGAVPTNAVDGLWPRAGVDADALVAALNASVGAAAMEVTGRNEAGMLQLMTYETASLPTLDVRRLDGAARERLAEAGAAFARDPTPARRAALDEAAVAAFDLPVEPSALGDWARALRRRRVEGGETVAVPLD